MGTKLFAGIALKHNEQEFRKVLTEKGDIFKLPIALAEKSINYAPSINLDPDDWFRLEKFSARNYHLSLPYNAAVSSANYDELVDSDFGKIVFLCGEQDRNYFFQRVTTTRQIRKRFILLGALGAPCRYEENRASIFLKDNADAIYIPSKDSLYFQKLQNIKAIFIGISELYREATEDEVQSFLEYNFIELNENFTSANVGPNNRSRIASATETIRNLSIEDQQKIFSYIKDYCPDLATSESKFRINTEKDLKRLLYGIDQRYYTTPVGEEKRLANSAVPI